MCSLVYTAMLSYLETDFYYYNELIITKIELQGTLPGKKTEDPRTVKKYLSFKDKKAHPKNRRVNSFLQFAERQPKILKIQSYDKNAAKTFLRERMLENPFCARKKVIFSENQCVHL